MSAKAQSYQELKTELDNILAELQHEDTDIDKAVELHKQGRKVLKELETYLQKIADNAELDIKIKKGE